MNSGPGEVWLADLGLAAEPRPIVIVSRRDAQLPRALVLYVPLTTQYCGSPLRGANLPPPLLNHDSFANVQGMASLPTVRLERVSEQTGDEIRER